MKIKRKKVISKKSPIKPLNRWVVSLTAAPSILVTSSLDLSEQALIDAYHAKIKIQSTSGRFKCRKLKPTEKIKVNEQNVVIGTIPSVQAAFNSHVDDLEDDDGD